MNKEEAVSYIRNRIYRYIDVDNECTDEYIRERISREMHLFSKDNIISVNDKDYISKRVFDSIRGLDVLEGFLRDDCITEIMVNGTDNIFIEKLGSLYQSDSCFEDEKRLNDTAMRIASRSNRIVNAKNPILDTVLDDGSRVCVVLSPVSKNGTSITIRKFYDNPLTMEDLINGGTISEEAADYLINAVKQKKNIFITIATLTTRAAIQGGMNLEEAYQLADVYIQDCEHSQNLTYIENLNYSMLIDFAERVAKGKIPGGMSKEIFDCVQFISRHVNEPIQVGDVTEHIGKSRSYLTKKFKKELGFDISSFIMRCKLEESKSLLTFTEKSLSEISSYLCFSSQAYFQNVFKKKYGITPTQYRKQTQQIT